MNLALRQSRFDLPVVLIGKQGTGKEGIAKTIHFNSKRSKGPFYKLNCGSIVPQDLEMELFGQNHLESVRLNRKLGILEAANQGSVYLEDINKMPLYLQARLMSVIQDQVLQGGGEPDTIPINARIMAGTNRPLEEFVEKGLFRLDLFYALNVLPIIVPERRVDKKDLRYIMMG